MKKITYMLVAILTTIGMVSLQNVVYAEDSLVQEEVKIEVLENKISTALTEINEHRLASEVLSQDIENLLAEQKELQEEILRQQKMVNDREDYLKKHLVSMQTSNFAHNGVMQLVYAKNFTDFVNRLMIIGQLFNAEETTINTIVGDISDLEEMEQAVEKNKQMLIEKQEKMEEETAIMTDGIRELQRVLSENKAVFEELMKRRAEEERIAEEKRIAEELASQSEQDTSESIPTEQEVSESKKVEMDESKSEQEPNEQEKVVENDTVKENSDVEATPSTPQQVSEGEGYKIIAVEATAYSYREAGLTHHTASGIDLRENSMVIAVDPTVIPLGSLVEVPGYGIAIAGDTGGAIKGNRIDVHFPDVASCKTFGRKHFEIKIFS